VQPGAPFCGRCGAPQVSQAFAAAPVYSYPVAPRPAYPARRFGTSQIAVAGVLLAVLAIVTVALSTFVVSRFAAGSRSTCIVNCAPKIITPLPESNTYRSSTYKFEVDYSSTWTVRSQDSSGISLGTRLGLVQVAGMKSSQSLQQVLQATVAALPTANWQDVVQFSDLKGAHIGDQDGLGAVRPGVCRNTETRERESIRRWRCGASITMLSVWVPKKSRRTVRSAGRGLISTLCETSCWPSPLRGSSRSEHRAKLTELS